MNKPKNITVNEGCKIDIATNFYKEAVLIVTCNNRTHAYKIETDNCKQLAQTLAGIVEMQEKSNGV